MRDDPDTLDLIRTARAALKADVLPHLPPDRRRAVLMVINALGIAGRQISDGAQRRAEALAALQAVATGTSLDAVNADLGATLREGKPPADPVAIHRALVVQARIETAESHPRAPVLSDSIDDKGRTT
jgi:hypothetical protein